MRGGIAQRARDAGPGRSAEGELRRVKDPRTRNKRKAKVYRRRRVSAVLLSMTIVVALITVAFTQTSTATDRPLPIDSNAAGPNTALARIAGVDISTPIRPNNITGLGYHPEGDNLLELAPRGKNLSSSALGRLIFGGSTPEKIQYYIMSGAGRPGSPTGALDVGAEAGTPVYTPVTGTVTAIRPDPLIQDAFVVEIKPADNPNIRISISLVRELAPNAGVKAPVTSGMTQIGVVADSAAVLKPQLATYTSASGNHVTITASKVR